MIKICSFVLLIAAFVYSQEHQPCKAIENKAGIYLARVATNCSVYDVCSGSVRLATMSCGTGLVFSSTYSICVYRDSIYDDCKKTAPTGGFYNDPLCKPRPNGLNIDPTDCSRYVPCFNHTSKPSMSCQKNLYFNFNQQRCMAKDKVNCHVTN